MRIYLCLPLIVLLRDIFRPLAPALTSSLSSLDILWPVFCGSPLSTTGPAGYEAAQLFMLQLVDICDSIRAPVLVELVRSVLEPLEIGPTRNKEGRGAALRCAAACLAAWQDML